MKIIDIKKLFSSKLNIRRITELCYDSAVLVPLSEYPKSDKKEITIFDTESNNLYKVSSNEILSILKTNGKFSNLSIVDDDLNEFCKIGFLCIYCTYFVYDNAAYYLMRYTNDKTTTLVFWFKNIVYMSNTWIGLYDKVVGFSFSGNKFMPYKFDADSSYIDYTNMLPKFVTPQLLIDRGAKVLKEMSLQEFKQKCLSGYFSALCKLAVKE